MTVEQSLDLKFIHSDVGAYFAAQALINSDLSSRVDAARLFSWRKTLTILAGLGAPGPVTDLLLAELTPYRIILADDILLDIGGEKDRRHKLIDLLCQRFDAPWARQELLRIGAGDEFLKCLGTCDRELRETIAHDLHYTYFGAIPATPKGWITVLLALPDTFATLKDVAAREMRNSQVALREIGEAAESADLGQSWRLHLLLESLIIYPDKLGLLFGELVELLESPNTVVAASVAKSLSYLYKYEFILPIIRPALERTKKHESESIRELAISIYANLGNQNSEIIREAANWGFSDPSTTVRDQSITFTHGKGAEEILAYEAVVIDGLIGLLDAYRPMMSMGFGESSPPAKALARLAAHNKEIIGRILALVGNAATPQIQAREARNCISEMCRLTEKQTKPQDPSNPEEAPTPIESSVILDSFERFISSTDDETAAAYIVSLIPTYTGARDWFLPLLSNLATKHSSEVVRANAVYAFRGYSEEQLSSLENLVSSVEKDPSPEVLMAAMEGPFTSFAADPIVRAFLEGRSTDDDTNVARLADNILARKVDTRESFESVGAEPRDIASQKSLSELATQLEEDKLSLFASAALALSDLSRVNPEAIEVLEKYLETAPSVRWLGITEALALAGKITPKMADRYIRAICAARLAPNFSDEGYWGLLEWLLETFTADSIIVQRTLEIRGSLIGARGKEKDPNCIPVPKAIQQSIREFFALGSTPNVESQPEWDRIVSAITHTDGAVRLLAGQVILQEATRAPRLLTLIYPLLDDSDLLVSKTIANEFATLLPDHALRDLERMLGTSKNPHELEEALKIARGLISNSHG